MLNVKNKRILKKRFGIVFRLFIKTVVFAFYQLQTLRDNNLGRENTYVTFCISFDIMITISAE